MKASAESTGRAHERGKRADRAVARRSNAEITAETRARILAAGRKLFADRGFAATAGEDVVAAAGLTRGALYYQFGDMRGLFRAVALAIAVEMTTRLAEDTMRASPADVDELEVGADRLLQAFGDAETAAILLRDGPVVLGWAGWNALLEEAGLPELLRHALGHWVDAGVLEQARLEPTLRLLVGAIMQAGVAIAESTSRRAAVASYRESLRGLLHGLRASAA
jgi:AcrR family transcriptional regulator